MNDNEVKRSTISLRGAQRIADVPRRIFGSFIEHLGRSVYGGIYEPEHESANEHGFRGDVLNLVKELGVTCVRYPGGNFVSNYRWQDGVGPKNQRPVRRDLAWHTTEPNQVGLDDFYHWSKAAGTEIMMAINMGTQGLQSALDEIEYANGAPGTALADWRVANGIREPMDIRMWCIGNEMDGPWQVGHMSAEEYAVSVERTAHAMKLAEPGLELVACGSSSASMPTFGTWERTVLTRAYDYLDFVSCHAYYFERGAKSPQDFLASGENMKHFIATVAAQADDAKAAHQGEHDIALSFDEWGVWYQDDWNRQEAEWKAQNRALHHESWPTAPHLLEDTYTVRDAVVEGALMIELLAHCDRVRSASRAQLVNVIAPIMTQNNGPAWKQTVFYPFAFAAHHAVGDAFAPTIHSSQVHTESYGEVDAVRAVVTFDQQTHSGCVLMVNRDMQHTTELQLDLQDLLPNTQFTEIIADEQVLLHDDNPYATNTIEHPDRVKLRTLDITADTEHPAQFTVTLPEESWAGFAFHVA